LSSAREIAEFHEDLRRKSRSTMLWPAVVFITVTVAWTVFDRILEPALANRFLAMRLVLAGVDAVITLMIVRGPLARRSFEGWWLWLLIFGVCIGPMLAETRTSLPQYAMGYFLIPFGAGLLPYWSPRWSLSILFILGAIGVGCSLLSPAPPRDIISAIFFVCTGVGIAGFNAIYKYNFSRRDYFNRLELAEVVRRESEAKERLGLATRELQDANAKLQAADKRKNAFFANVSHELRTPLTLILAPVEELLAHTGEVENRRALGTVRRNAERLLRLIDDILDLARLDAGGLRLVVAECELRHVTQTVVDNATPAAASKGLILEHDPGISGRRIWGDAHRLEIIITNLVGNAIKYTPRNGHIEVRVHDDEDAQVVQVIDDGVGISAENQARIFERFYQIGHNDRRSQGGVGIGLSLARELAELHGGKLEVASNAGRGTTFTLRIPHGRAHIRPEVIERRKRQSGQVLGRRAEDVSGEVSRAGRVDGESGMSTLTELADGLEGPQVRRSKVLVVDDNDELRALIIDLLAPEHEVLSARDGAEGLALVRNQAPDLVVSDVMMPNMSGGELCRAIKTDPALSSIPVILLTARAGSDATIEGYAQGADDFVAKPFHPRVLMARVRVQLRLRQLSLDLAEREKLAAVGTLAAGVLHEVRNPVNAILNSARVLATSTRLDDERKRKLIKVIIDGGERIEGISQGLDKHARPADGGLSAQMSLRDGLEGSLRLLEHRLAEVQVERQFTEVPPVAAPVGPVNQVLLNLLDNAVKAGARRLTLILGLHDDGRVLVRVGDDGVGIAEAERERIFSPFVTNSANGSGSGLGLYVSRRIIEQHRGRIWCESREGGGTWFNVVLPAITDGEVVPLSGKPEVP
jgi:signal transduction histidine kinase